MTTISNPFSNQQIQPRATTALANTDQQRAIAEVQAAMLVARANPRDQVAAMDRIINACSRPTLAMAATYDYARGGTQITGPSIRLAEAIAQNWGNIQFGIRELDQSNGESTVQAYCWDIETNSRREVTFQVPHIRYSRAKGNSPLSDPRDIYETVANVGARRLRACILAVIPGDVTEAAVAQCEETLKANVDTSDDAIKRLLKAFADFGISKAQIEKRIQRRVDSILPAQVIGLRKIYNSLREGMSTASDWFGDEVSEAADSIMNAARSEQDKQKPKTAENAWPKQVNGTWEDSRGLKYDKRIHGWSTTHSRPAVAASTGEFAKLRGCDPALHQKLEAEQIDALQRAGANIATGLAEADDGFGGEEDKRKHPQEDSGYSTGPTEEDLVRMIDSADGDIDDVEDLVRSWRGTEESKSRLYGLIQTRKQALRSVDK